MAKCLYCEAPPEELWASMEDAIAIPHPEPLAACHIVVAPRRHVQAFYDLDVQEQRAVWNLVGEIQKRISLAIEVKGFAVGFADGDAETGEHAHVHVVPRALGDALELPAGIEWVKPEA